MAVSQKFSIIRRQVHQTLVDIAGSDVKVYYQPPTNVSLQYPCIVYRSTGTNTAYANNEPYYYVYEFEIVVMSMDPEFQLPYDILNGISYTSITSQYQRDNIYHTAIRLAY